jgi:hypothetical protein
VNKPGHSEHFMRRCKEAHCCGQLQSTKASLDHVQ